MSVVGIDFGNDTCYIAVARAGGIETVANDYSSRDTPSYVAFTGKQRIMGFSAKSQMLTNLKRTFFGFKCLLGRKFRDPIVQQELRRLPHEISEGRNGQILINVDYMGKPQTFTPEQITAMLFTKLKETVDSALQAKCKDVVISVPSYFTDAERRGLLDAATTAGFTVLKLMNDTTATALAYGIYKQDLPAAEEKARNVIFVDCGHQQLQVAACSFNKGKLSVQALGHERTVGGRGFSEALATHFGEEFKSRYKIDPASKPRAWLKLLTEVEKIKKQMSANTNKLPLNIECFMDDKDVTAKIDRTQFEELLEPLLQRTEAVFKQVLADTKWKREDIYAVEIVGGSTRVPAVKALIEAVFGKAPNTTLNADEAVARGCALQCAILSPTFKVREFSVTDAQPFAIKLKWQAEADDGQMEVFPKFHSVPFSKMLTFWRREPFVVVSEYAEPVPYPDPHIGSFEIMDVKPQADGTNQKVKVKVRVNLNGVFTVATASLVEKIEVEEEVPMEVDPPPATAVVNDSAAMADGEKSESAAASAAAADEDLPLGGSAAAAEKNDVEMKEESASAAAAAAAAAEKPPAAAAATAAATPEKQPAVRMEKRKKLVNKTVDLPVVGRVVGSLSSEALDEATALERQMNAQDRNEADRLHAKNAVEEYIYDIRSKIVDELAPFISDDDRSKFAKELEAGEEWLYEDGEECERQVYVDKLKQFKVKGEAIKKRKREWEERPVAIEGLGRAIQLARKAFEAYKAGDDKYAHLDEASMDKVRKQIDEKNAWLETNCAAIAKVTKTSNPPVLAVQFDTERQSFNAAVNPILSKPKPKVEPPPPPPPKDDVAAAAEDNAADGKPTSSAEMSDGSAPAAAPAASADPPPTTNGDKNMDLD